MARILLVEDDASLNRGIEFALTLEKHSVTGVFTIAEARELIASGDIDLIILDINLPDGDGFEFCGEIRKSSSVPILYLTARDSELDIVRGLDLGGDDYMSKPFRLRELISRVNALVRRAGVRQDARQDAVEPGQQAVLGSTVLKARDLVFNEETMILEKQGRQISLSKTEFKLLRYFMRNPNAVLSRDRLLQNLWDLDGDFIDENTVAVNVRRLREKIEDDPATPVYIQTVRGLGYRFCC
jgi:DNA-binding response OmpR family regulator